MNKYILKFPTEVVGQPVLAETILETGVVLNILRAQVDYNEGTIVVSIQGDEEKQKKVVDLLTKKGVEVTKTHLTYPGRAVKIWSCHKIG